MDHDHEVSILYKNYRGEERIRRILPQRLWFGTNKWHSEAQWFIDALDLDRQIDRTFALKDIKRWGVD